MPPRSPSRSPAATSDASTARGHVVDRAVAIHRVLAAAARSPEGRRQATAEARQRFRVTKGYVSVLGYLGGALAGMEPDDLAQLRTPAITTRSVWPLVSAARSAEREARRSALTDDAREAARRRAVVDLRAALRAAASGTAGLGTPGQRSRAGARSGTGRSAAARSVGWSYAGWTEDPRAFVRAHLTALVAAHGHVAEQATRAVATAGAERAIADQVAAEGEGSLLHVGGPRWRALAAVARGARTPAEDAALGELAIIARKLGEAAAEIANGRGSHPAAEAPAGSAPVQHACECRPEAPPQAPERSPSGTFAPIDVDADELADDLAE